MGSKSWCLALSKQPGPEAACCPASFLSPEEGGATEKGGLGLAFHFIVPWAPLSLPRQVPLQGGGAWACLLEGPAVQEKVPGVVSTEELTPGGPRAPLFPRQPLTQGAGAIVVTGAAVSGARTSH